MPPLVLPKKLVCFIVEHWSILLKVSKGCDAHLIAAVSPHAVGQPAMPEYYVAWLPTKFDWLDCALDEVEQWAKLEVGRPIALGRVSLAKDEMTPGPNREATPSRWHVFQVSCHIELLANAVRVRRQWMWWGRGWEDSIYAAGAVAATQTTEQLSGHVTHPFILRQQVQHPGLRAERADLPAGGRRASSRRRPLRVVVWTFVWCASQRNCRSPCCTSVRLIGCNRLAEQVRRRPTRMCVHPCRAVGARHTGRG